MLKSQMKASKAPAFVRSTTLNTTMSFGNNPKNFDKLKKKNKDLQQDIDNLKR